MKAEEITAIAEQVASRLAAYDIPDRIDPELKDIVTNGYMTVTQIPSRNSTAYSTLIRMVFNDDGLFLEITLASYPMFRGTIPYGKTSKFVKA